MDPPRNGVYTSSFPKRMLDQSECHGMAGAFARSMIQVPLLEPDSDGRTLRPELRIGIHDGYLRSMDCYGCNDWAHQPCWTRGAIGSQTHAEVARTDAEVVRTDAEMETKWFDGQKTLIEDHWGSVYERVATYISIPQL